jgi:2-methylcitrate dehydratase PrpD
MTAPEETLAAFVSRLSVADLPVEVQQRVRLLALDAIACAFAGFDAEHAPEVRSVAQTLAGDGVATVIGGTPLAAAGAALINGFHIAAPTVGDVHRATLTHVMPEVLPAALAAAQLSGPSGSDFVSGVAAGMEACVRVAEALDTDEYRARAFHNPGIAGAVGAACAAARVLRLDARGVAVAIGHAASQAGGTFVALGTDGVKVHQARGALSGLLAAQLAAAGVDASDRALTGDRGGLLWAYAGGGLPDGLTRGISEEWRLLEIALRRWPAASSLQPVIEATLSLRTEIGDDAAERVTIALPGRAYALNGTAGWESRLSALQSARWMAAVALADGDVWLEQTNERLNDAQVARFAADAITVVEDRDLPSTGARVEITTRTGGRHARAVEQPCGDPSRPLTHADVGRKLDRALAGRGLAQRGPRIVEAILNIESAAGVAGLTSLLEVR